MNEMKEVKCRCGEVVDAPKDKDLIDCPGCWRTIMNVSITCDYCGKEVQFVYNNKTNKKLYKNRACFSCNFWIEILEDIKHGKMNKSNDLQLIAVSPDYNVFYVHKFKENPKSKHKLGYNGRMMQFTTTTGEKVRSNDVWHRGCVPEHLRDKFTPNVL